MAKLSKRQKAFSAVDRERFYGVDEAIALVKGNASAKFDETVEVALNLGVDPRHADQMVRGVVSLPRGTGKSVRVAVFAKGAKADEARAAGADVVGAEDLMETVQGGTIDFDRVIATPDMMGVVGRQGQVRAEALGQLVHGPGRQGRPRGNRRRVTFAWPQNEFCGPIQDLNGRRAPKWRSPAFFLCTSATLPRSRTE